MTYSFLALKEVKNYKSDNKQLAQLIVSKGEQILMSDASAKELEIDLLVEAGYLKKLTEAEALKHYQLNK